MFMEHYFSDSRKKGGNKREKEKGGKHPALTVSMMLAVGFW